MIPKLFVWLFGAKMASSLIGILGGAMAGIGTAASLPGGMTKEALVQGAVGGILAALAGAKGRAHGEIK